MLLIQQVSEKMIASDYVRCPCCKRGRICDKPSGTRIKDVPQRDTPINGNEPTVILKCPKCGKKFSIQLNNTK